MSLVLEQPLPVARDRGVRRTQHSSPIALRAIFVTSSLSHGGAEGHAIAVMNRLAERGHECHAVYIKSSAGQLDRVRLRDGGTVRCLNAAHYFDVRAVGDP